MAFGFPAYHTEQYSVEPNTVDLCVVVKSALAALAWPEKEVTSNQIVAASSINIWSWGEKIVISFVSNHAISITSQCALPTQCIDWGKNRTNVTKLLAEIRKHC